MKRPRYIRWITGFSVFILIISQFFIQPGCANVIPPSGGPKDTLPPLLVDLEPRDSTPNFNERTITFTFDEYVTVEPNYQQLMLVSPTPDRFPEVKSRLRTVTVKLYDTLEPNTTYNIDFGRTIKDINESNVLTGFSYIFTTGEAIDSLELTGKVILAETGKIDTTLIVMLHRSGRDSSVVTEKPRYIARLDKGGNFRFRFLPPGTFYIYALEDPSGQRKYIDPTRLFAFADSPIVIGTEQKPITLYAYVEDKKATTTTTPLLTQPRPGTSRPDDRRLKFFTNLNMLTQDLLDSFVMTFEQPVRNFDPTKLILTTDSAFNPIPGYTWQQDTSSKKIWVNLPWKENTLYNLVLDRDFAEDTSGRKLLKTDTIRFTTRKRNDYGSLRIRFRNLDLEKNPVLQFIQSEQVIKSYPLNSATFSLPMVLPGEYGLRILLDRNKNGVWDPGDFFIEKRQPEIVIPIERRINIRPGFDNEFEIAL